MNPCNVCLYNPSPHDPKDHHAMTPAELTAARTKAGMSQAALARAIGYSKRTIQRYEAGDWPIPQVFALAVAAVSQPTTKRGGPKPRQSSSSQRPTIRPNTTPENYDAHA